MVYFSSMASGCFDIRWLRTIFMKNSYRGVRLTRMKFITLHSLNYKFTTVSMATVKGNFYSSLRTSDEHSTNKKRFYVRLYFIVTEILESVDFSTWILSGILQTERFSLDKTQMFPFFLSPFDSLLFEIHFFISFSCFSFSRSLF